MTKPLWAPWRLEYIQQADEQDGCLFCDAVESDDDEAALVVHRGRWATVVVNKYPYASGHFMVAPNRHVGEFGELTDDEALDVHRLAHHGIGALAQVYGPGLQPRLEPRADRGRRRRRPRPPPRRALAGPATRTSCRCWRT